MTELLSYPRASEARRNVYVEMSWISFEEFESEF